MSDSAPPHRDPAQDPRHGRLSVRHHPPVAPGSTGLVPMAGPDGDRVAMAYAPEPAADGSAYRLVLLMHGAGGSARQGLDLLLPVADAHHLLLVAPQSSAASWDLIDAVLAFSPGFAAPPVTHGRPRLFISHGVDDRVLPIDVCSRRLVPHLHDLGYDVTYEVFQGGHEIPTRIRDTATTWLTTPPPS